MHVESRYLADPEHFTKMNTAEIRRQFLIDTLFLPNQIELIYSHCGA